METKDRQQIFAQLKSLLLQHQGKLVITTNQPGNFQLYTHKPVEIAGRKRPNVYFGGVILQKDYVGFYFMPVYVKSEMQEMFSENLLQLLKGKSCFHVKKLFPALVSDISDALKQGHKLYEERGWL